MWEGYNLGGFQFGICIAIYHSCPLLISSYHCCFVYVFFGPCNNSLLSRETEQPWDGHMSLKKDRKQNMLCHPEQAWDGDMSLKKTESRTCFACSNVNKKEHSDHTISCKYLELMCSLIMIFLCKQNTVPISKFAIANIKLSFSMNQTLHNQYRIQYLLQMWIYESLALPKFCNQGLSWSLVPCLHVY